MALTQLEGVAQMLNERKRESDLRLAVKCIADSLTGNSKLTRSLPLTNRCLVRVDNVMQLDYQYQPLTGERREEGRRMRRKEGDGSENNGLIVPFSGSCSVHFQSFLLFSSFFFVPVFHSTVVQNRQEYRLKYRATRLHRSLALVFPAPPCVLRFSVFVFHFGP